MPSSQSWPAAVIDLATLAALVAIAFGHVSEPAAWTLLGAIVSGRFGVSLGKEIGRVSTNRPPSDGGSGGSAPRFQAVMPPPTSDRPPDTIPAAPAIRPPARVPRPDPRRERISLGPILAAIAGHYIRRPTAIVVVAAVVTLGFTHGCTTRPPVAAVVTSR